jgi:hypothetical protein
MNIEQFKLFEQNLETGHIIEMTPKQLRWHDRDYREWLIKMGKLKPKTCKK